MYNLRNIRDLLNEGFSKEEIIELCFYEPQLKPVYDSLQAAASKPEVIRLVIDFAYQKLQMDVLLEAARKLNPARYEIHQPYTQSEADRYALIHNNDLGYGVKIGGEYQGHTLEAVALGWSEYGEGWVKSGWLYISPWSQCLAITFFKVHLVQDGTGYVHINDASYPIHSIWLETSAGFRKTGDFHYLNKSTTVWDFKWKA